jgi:hypothetical protein
MHNFNVKPIWQVHKKDILYDVRDTSMTMDIACNHQSLFVIIEHVA